MNEDPTEHCGGLRTWTAVFSAGPAGLAAANRASLAAFPQRDPAVLGAEISDQARAFVAAAAGRSPREGVLTPMGPMDLATLGSYLLTHLLGHGYDIAVALSGPHMVDRNVVRFTLPFMRLAMPRVVSAGAADHRACYLVRTGHDRFAVTFVDGVPTGTDTPPRRPDCTEPRSLSGAANRGWARASRRSSQRRRRADGGRRRPASPSVSSGHRKQQCGVLMNATS